MGFSGNPSNNEIKWVKYADIETEGNIPSDLVRCFKDGTNPDDGLAKYDFHDSFDMFHMNIPDNLKDMSVIGISSLGVYISKTEVICAYSCWEDKTAVFSRLIERVGLSGAAKGFSHRRIILSIIDYMTKDDGKILGKLEDCISALEDRALNSDDNTVKEIFSEISIIKYSLFPLKQMYEQLMDAMEDLMEDDNNIYDDNEIKYCSRIYSRVERLYKTVENLREYVTQTREACQAQMDISLNNIMKIFTLITAIFLPLTLLAGWYGMNFESMPELAWRYGYISAIAASICIIAFCLILFKKKKWF